MIWKDIIITDPFIEEKVKECPKCRTIMTNQFLSNDYNGSCGYRCICKFCGIIKEEE